MRKLEMTQILFLAACSLAPAAAAAQPVTQAKPATQACLGDFDAFLTCPAGSQRSGTECRAREPHRGKAPGEHWSGSQRQGPAIFLRNDDEKDPAKLRVSFAAHYKDHKKTGRVFRFDRDGRLESWSDLAADQHHGLSVSCTPEGRVYYLAYYDRDRSTGVSRTWRASDGSFSFAYTYDASGKGQPIEVSPAQMQRPDHLCQPARCDVQARPVLWTAVVQ